MSAVFRLALFAVLALAAAAPALAGETPTVVELFTSQGCSSCPPADALLGDLASRPDVLALGFHVDYWDRLGWKDPYSSADATARQEHYRDLLALTTVYTPQIVVDGHWQAVGSDSQAVEDAIRASHRDGGSIPVAIAISQGHARVTVAPSGGGASGAVILVGFDRRHDTAVARGENAGRKAVDVNAVRGIAQIGRLDGKESTIDAAIPWHCDRVAALVAAADGHILGAAVGDAGATP